MKKTDLKKFCDRLFEGLSVKYDFIKWIRGEHFLFDHYWGTELMGKVGEYGICVIFKDLKGKFIYCFSDLDESYYDFVLNMCVSKLEEYVNESKD